MLTQTIENAQKKVEQQNYLIRKRVLEYDDVMNEQRRVVYKYRREILEGRDMSDVAHEELEEVVSRMVETYTPGEIFEDWDLGGLEGQPAGSGRSGSTSPSSTPQTANREQITEMLIEDALAAYDRREEEFGEELMRYLERQILLQIIDNRWREHLYEMDYLREGIHLRGFAQIDPLVAYKNEGFTMFQELMDSIWEEFARVIFHVEVNIEPAQAEQMFGRGRAPPRRRRPVLGRRRRGAALGARRGAGAAGAVATAAGAAERPTAATGGGNGQRRQPRRPWSSPRTRRPAATTPAGAARARSTRSATAPSGASRVASSLPLVLRSAAPGLRRGRDGDDLRARLRLQPHATRPSPGATIRVRELPKLSAITDANGDYALEVPDDANVTPYIEPPAGYNQIDLQTFHTRGKDIENANFQTPADFEYEALAAILGVPIGPDGRPEQCVIVTTASARNVRGVDFETFHERTPHGVAGRDRPHDAARFPGRSTSTSP